MELSGNVWERPVTVGNATGRLFDGLHGNGALTVGGEADVSNWPGTAATGAGYRGGSWFSASVYARASYRLHAASVDADRFFINGGRGVRSAPSGVGP
jgi:formylglycine-generating enzyme required for sulfatase activity